MSTMSLALSASPRSGAAALTHRAQAWWSAFPAGLRRLRAGTFLSFSFFLLLVRFSVIAFRFWMSTSFSVFGVLL